MGKAQLKEQKTDWGFPGPGRSGQLQRAWRNARGCGTALHCHDVAVCCGCMHLSEHEGLLIRVNFTYINYTPFCFVLFPFVFVLETGSHYAV